MEANGDIKTKAVLLNEFHSPDIGYVPGGFVTEEFEDMGDLIEKHPIGRTYTTGE